MEWDTACIGVGLELGYVLCKNSNYTTNTPEMWRWGGMMLALGLAWGWEMCLV